MCSRLPHGASRLPFCVWLWFRRVYGVWTFPPQNPRDFSRHTGVGGRDGAVSNKTLPYSDFTYSSNKPNQQPALPLLTAEAPLRPIN